MGQPRTTVESMRKRVRVSSGCWLWQGAIGARGYGLVSVNYKTSLAHRAMYEFVKGPIPVGLTLDHLCRVRRCINPDHLEPVTRETNVLRGVGLTAKNAAKTHCKHGHSLDDAFRYKGKSGSLHRACRPCINIRNEYYRAHPKLKYKFNCAVCGKPFRTHNKHKRTCDNSCRTKIWKSKKACLIPHGAANRHTGIRS